MWAMIKPAAGQVATLLEHWRYPPRRIAADGRRDDMTFRTDAPARKNGAHRCIGPGGTSRLRAAIKRLRPAQGKVAGAAAANRIPGQRPRRGSGSVVGIDIRRNLRRFAMAQGADHPPNCFQREAVTLLAIALHVDRLESHAVLGRAMTGGAFECRAHPQASCHLRNPAPPVQMLIMRKDQPRILLQVRR